MSARVDARPVSDWWRAIQDEENPGMTVPSGFERVDQLLKGGLPRRALTVVAGARCMGVSAILHTIALKAVQHSHSPASFVLAPLDHGPFVAAQRFMTMLSGENLNMPPQTIRDDRGHRLTEAAEQFDSLPIHIWDAPRELRSFCDEAASLHMDLRFDILAVDTAQCLRSTIGTGMERSEEVRAIYAALKRLALDLDVAVLIGADLRSFSDKWPQYHDLHDPRAIEEHADAVMLVHRPMYYCCQESELPDWCTDPAETRLILVLNRRGPTGTQPLLWDAHRLQFAPYDCSRYLTSAEGSSSQLDSQSVEDDDIPF